MQQCRDKTDIDHVLTGVRVVKQAYVDQHQWTEHVS